MTRASARTRKPVERYDPSHGRRDGSTTKTKTTRASEAKKRTRKPTTVSTTTTTGKKRKGALKRDDDGRATKRTAREKTQKKSCDPELPDDVWMLICETTRRRAFEEKKTRTNRKGVVVDERREVYRWRLEALLAIRQVCGQLRRLLSGEFGEGLFRRAFEDLAEFTEATRGVDDAPATMLWRHKAWFLTRNGCQGCDAHPTMRKPNWTFGVRMCKDCMMKRTVTDRALRNDEVWRARGTYTELTVGLPSDEVHGWSAFFRDQYTMTRFWKASVKKRVALLRRAKTPAERAKICAPATPRVDAHAFEKNARKRREEELKAELALVGCEMRPDSKLSELFIDGFPNKRNDRLKWTAKAVAHRMAEMKYLHEYCAEFRQTIREWREEIRNLYDDGYRGNVTYEVTRFYNFGAAVRDLADTWTDFPARWPWL